MRSRLPVAIFSSLIFHGVAGYLIMRVPPAEEPPRPTPVEVTWIDQPPPGTKGGGTSAPGQGPKISLSKLRSVMKIPGPEATALNPVTDAQARGTGEWPTEAWGSGGGNFGEIANFLHYDRLRVEIRGLLNYPAILARRGITGTVNARLAFTGRSQCDWKKIKIDSHERHLRVYILALLKKLCALNVVKNLNAGRQTTIDISFQFDVINESTPYSLQRDSDFIVSNVIAFRRTTTKSIMEYRLGPIRGVWFAPAVALDFPWLVEKWDYYVNGIDPMAPFRD